MSKKEVVEAVCTMVGFIIGAGILGIPFVVAKSGFLTGMLVIVLVGLVMMLVNLYLGEVNLRTKLNHQLTGLARIYLGRAGWCFMLFSVVFGMYSALTAYIIEEGTFLMALLSPFIGGHHLAYSLAIFIALGLVVWLGLEWVERSEVIMVFVMLAVLAVIGFVTAPYIGIGNFSGFDFSKMLLPFGVVLFAYLGTGSIPEVREELRSCRQDMRKVVLLGSAIPIVVYALFTFLVVGVTGIATTESAMIGLKGFLGYRMVVFGLLFGIVTMATSFLAVGTALKEAYMFDFGLKSRAASALALLVPLAAAFVIVLLGVKNAFYYVISISGAFAGGVDIILIVLMHWRAKRLSQRSPEYSIPKSSVLGSIVIAVAVVGMLYAILSAIGLV